MSNELRLWTANGFIVFDSKIEVKSRRSRGKPGHLSNKEVDLEFSPYFRSHYKDDKVTLRLHDHGWRREVVVVLLQLQRL